jgi:coatomer subunit beta'
MLGNGTVAVKKLSETLDIEDTNFKLEVHSLMIVKHKNIIRFLGYCSDTQGKMVNYNGNKFFIDARERLLCFEYLPNGSLEKQITGKIRFIHPCISAQ